MIIPTTTTWAIRLQNGQYLHRAGKLCQLPTFDKAANLAATLGALSIVTIKTTADGVQFAADEEDVETAAIRWGFSPACTARFPTTPTKEGASA